MKRRTITALAAMMITIGHAPLAMAQTKTLRVAVNNDLRILDPTFTPAYITRNFGHMVYDTLFAQDVAGKPRPQMVESWTVSNDGKAWSFTLRPGLVFSDGSPVEARDVVASLVRWGARDGLGRALGAVGAQWKAVDARSFSLVLAEPFALVLEALAKPSAYPPVILPGRLAKMPTTAPLTEVIGSGPFVFKRDEWVPGSRAVFVRNPRYVARNEPPDGLSGSKRSRFERVEWLYLPDTNTAVAALRRGEVDLVEQVPPDYVAPLRTDPAVTLGSAGAWQGWLVMNQLHPPFNDARVRQALLKAVAQDRFVAAMGFARDMRMTYCATFFICGSANETAAGAEPYRTPDAAAARRLLAEAGYKGERVVLLAVTDDPGLNAAALMAAQTMRSIGMEVDLQAMDFATMSARRTKRDAPAAGGWNVYLTHASEFDANSPVTNVYLAASCGNSLPGWPCDAQLDELRTAWVRETDPARRRQRLDAFQVRAYQAVPYISIGQFSHAFAARKELKHIDKLHGGLPLVWALDR